MLLLGADPEKSREMDLDDIFLSRLTLLIVMMKAHIEGYPMGKVRKNAVLENARHVESECIDLGRLVPGLKTGPEKSQSMDFDHVFYQRVKLLAAMSITIVKDEKVENHRKKSLKENLQIICEALTLHGGIQNADFLKVA